MLKKITLFALLFISMGAMAQEAKIAYFNSMEVVPAMPEYTRMQDSIQKKQASIENELKIMGEEYNKKYTAFMEQGDKLDESIKIRRLQEIKDLEERAQNFNQMSQQQLEQLYKSLLEPIQQKVKNAIAEIGAENHFAYILDVASLLYIDPSSTDATPLVKKKLGIK
ncbi:MAG: OmpH family outer membrane protein [Dysgonamonadaceae bacterium]|jgi:outer membrane protein|nr:OmpH family outer membrane protein [Dysgonamonadaceae bacterium]